MNEAYRGGACALPCTDVALLLKELSETSREHRGIPSAGVTKARYQLPRELGIIGVLAERKLRMGPLTGTVRPQPALYVYARDFGRLRLDHETKCVTQRLPEQGSGQPISTQLFNGGTSRPQCLQTFARARIRSAQ
jgi:hypothetical protein